MELPLKVTYFPFNFYFLPHDSLSPDNLRDAAKGMVSASVTASYNQSSHELNTKGTTSVAGVINVGGNPNL